MGDIEDPLITVLNELADHVDLLTQRYPQGFPCTRDGQRLALAAAFDETREVWEEWNANKRHLNVADATMKLEAEWFDLSAVAVMAILGIRAMHAQDVPKT